MPATVLTAIGAVREGDLITEAATPAGPFYPVVRNVPGLLTIEAEAGLTVDLPTSLSSAVLVAVRPASDDAEVEAASSARAAAVARAALSDGRLF